jgi:site-specific DNA-methyltransferase (adenine-specific)
VQLGVVYSRRGDTINQDKWNGWRIGNLRPKYEPIKWFMKPYKVGATLADNVLQHEVGAYNQDGYNQYVGNSDNVLSIGFEQGERGPHTKASKTYGSVDRTHYNTRAHCT